MIADSTRGSCRAHGRVGIAAVALALGASALACSFSYSSDSSSDSSRSSSDSSDSSGDEHARYRSDVEQYTLAFVHSGGDPRQQSFFMGLGDLARKRGVTDWESDPDTWEAIGRGLARSDANEAQQAALRAAWAGDDPARQGAIARGYASVH